MNLYTAILIIIFSLIVLLMFFYNMLYQGKTAYKYGNDERWKRVEEKANAVMINFFYVITVVCGLVILCSIFWKELNLDISLRSALTIIIFIIVIGNFCRTCAMKYFDKNM
ncbi:hypothetical protein OGZ44_03910 [Lactococcus lactis]|jgi:Na+/H+ antiporter NhaC|uniref:hypothetical protein n=1 Tax=Lactococcus lactis TaxID=1358 RepID=UPI00241663E4|nr:hypothetical protein [Lactococcus lactis]MDG4973401.1 hypothetical protein [Lactococcus lactis]